MKTVAFLNNKGGVGKTSLVYHLAWMYQELGLSVVAFDLDPQANLTAAFLPDDRLEQLWPDGPHPETVLGSVQPLLDRLGDVAEPSVETIAEHLALVAGDLGLNLMEDRLADAWSKCLSENRADAQDAFRVMTAFYRMMGLAASAAGADLVLVDVGPSLGSINRAALVASDHVVVPLGADLFSLQGLRNLGPTLRAWRDGWKSRREQRHSPVGSGVPAGSMEPIGYVVVHPVTYASRPVRAYSSWMARIPARYGRDVLGLAEGGPIADPDPYRLATLRHYRSLVPLAQDARKPIFLLSPADGAFGSHAAAVQRCYHDFAALARRIADACGVRVPVVG